MIRTRVGYTGGQKTEPTYTSLGDHTETLQIDYDPTHISYEALLEIFWNSHNPTNRPWSRQYMSAIFVHDESQKQLALETKARQEAMRQDKIFKGKIFTQIFPASDFYLAEDYHQKYYLQNSPGLWNEISRIYPDPVGWINSTAAARLNGYVGQYGSIANLEADLARLGLSPAGQEELQKVVNRFGK